jgi:glycerophosphoryl diester phosphodiesterase
VTFPPIVAHRGLAARFPENTLVGVSAALSAGARFLEVDLQLSADGVAFVHHDWETSRTCGAEGSIGDRSEEELCQLSASYVERFGDAFKGEPLPRLSELTALLSEHSDVTVFLEIKPQSVERFGADAVLDAVLPYAESLGARAVLLSFSIEVLRRAKERSPLERGVACESYKELMGATVSELDPRHVFCDVKSLPSSGDLSIEGRTLTVWEVINPELARALLDRGVDLIESFSCDTLIPALTRDKE